jgi:hypothetical protein
MSKSYEIHDMRASRKNGLGNQGIHYDAVNDRIRQNPPLMRALGTRVRLQNCLTITTIVL